MSSGLGKRPRRDKRFVVIDTLVDTSLLCRVPPRYLDDDAKGTPLGLTLTPRQREQIVKFICEVAEDFELYTQTAHLAVNYFDRWCAHACVQKHTRQNNIDMCWKRRKKLVTRMLATKERVVVSCTVRVVPGHGVSCIVETGTQACIGQDCAEKIVSYIVQPIQSDEEAKARRKELRRKVKRVCCVCLLVAAKFDDVIFPPFSELEKILHEECAEDIARLEFEILDVLGWQLNACTPHSFLHHLATLCDEYALQVLNDAEFFIDISPYEYTMLDFHPSVVASASLVLAWGEDRANQYMGVLSQACNVEASVLLKAVHILQNYYAEVFLRA